MQGPTLFCFLTLALPEISYAKWVEGRIDTKENWAFLARFCFLSFEGQFEYFIEFDRDLGTPNLLLYYDDDSQWPAVYHSEKSCKAREAVLNKGGQNQMIKLSHWYPDTEYSGCVVTRADKELPAAKSTTTTKTKLPPKPKSNSNPNNAVPDLGYYDQFLKTTSKSFTETNSTTNDTESKTTWYELQATDEFSTTEIPDEELWENIGPLKNSTVENLMDVELLFDGNNTGHKIKRSIELYERFRRRRLQSETGLNDEQTTKMVVSCRNSRRFRSARERWWFIAISNCDSPKGLDVRYKFLMTNGAADDFWHHHFSADEFYVLPILLTYTFAYLLVMVAVVMCSVELRSRHLLHSTYKLFLISIVVQHCGVLMQALAGIRYASNGVGAPYAKVFGQFFCGVSEMTFLLLLLLMAKGYTITRGRLKAGFTVKLTVFMCCYVVTYVVLFIYQAKAFDPGEVLYIYESPAGYGLIVLRIAGWCAFAYATFFTVKKYPEKNMFYCPFFICGTIWFYAGPLFILTANSYIDKWVRESVVTAVLLFITLSGHVMFLLLTLPVFANKNFPYHVRTTQIGVMQVTSHPALDSFGSNAYFPTNGAPQTVIIPLTRRTEELIGSMYQYLPSAPLSLETEPKLNGNTKHVRLQNGNKQDSTESSKSDSDINPHVPKEIFTVESQITKNENSIQEDRSTNSAQEMTNDSSDNVANSVPMLGDLPNVMRSKRNILEPIRRDVPTWSLAKGPSIVAMHKKIEAKEDPSPVHTKPPPVRSTAGIISTIHEGQEQAYSRNTDHLFTVSKR
ncbi:transmembrane protein 145-like [Leptidea sinapis]|uniref:transmembrane protein 145-like n=1 Tax=Leptidea sinapis TaxID=189913 RepID=UPI0021C366DD|nr:transmembrane protein 145-like [Leptidea sinapis]